MREDTVRVSAGIIGNNIAVNTNICQIATPGAGRYRIWGTARHTLEDGCKLIVGAALVIFRIPQSTNQVANFGPFVIDVLLNTDNIILQLAVATGAADTAAGAIYAVKLNQ